MNQLGIKPSGAQIHLSDYKQSINQALDSYLADVSAQLELDMSLTAKSALDKLQEYSLRPGKRIRGSLAAAAYDFAAGTTLGPAGLNLGVALELMQNYLLIVDDVMDKSDLRRGQPALQILFAKEKNKPDDHEANMLAINIGLVAQHLANLALLQAPESPDRVLEALRRIHINITATGLGQIDDLSHKVGRTISEKDLIRKYKLKSSYYTFINPLQAGLALAGVTSTKRFEEVKLFGESAGVAFQLHDDVLGIFGESADTGKLNADDIKEGKYTLLIHYTLKHAGKDEVSKLKIMLGNDKISEHDLSIAQTIISRCGAKNYVQQEAKRYSEIAKNRLSKTEIWDKDFKELLSDLLDYSINRQS